MAILVAAVAHTAQAADKTKSAVLVVDANTGRVLHQSAADEPRHPASLAKMMTIYLVFELIEQGQLSYQSKIKFSANAVAAAPSKLDLAEGEEIALLDAVKVLITKSANDVAVAMAEHIAGSEERFARLMTQKARQLGMTATVFRNASGLPDEAQVTTARDMVTLALRLQDDFPTPLHPVRDAHRHLQGRDLPQPQHHAPPLRGHGRHQDRLHAGLGVQPRGLGAPGQEARDRRRIRRCQRRLAQHGHAHLPQHGARQGLDRGDAPARRPAHRAGPGAGGAQRRRPSPNT